jgi:hypothetical protein
LGVGCLSQWVFFVIKIVTVRKGKIILNFENTNYQSCGKEHSAKFKLWIALIEWHCWLLWKALLKTMECIVSVLLPPAVMMTSLCKVHCPMWGFKLCCLWFVDHRELVCNSVQLNLYMNAIFPIHWLFLLRILIQSNSINTPNYSWNKNLTLR